MNERRVRARCWVRCAVSVCRAGVSSGQGPAKAIGNRHVARPISAFNGMMSGGVSVPFGMHL